MEYQEIYEILTKVGEMLIYNDAHLLRNDLSERCIVFRYALYLQHEFVINNLNYVIDCEYNGLPESENSKFIDPLLTELETLNLLSEREKELISEGKLNSDDRLIRRVFPDIIIHSRGITENNLAVLEFKKSSNTNHIDRKYDELKLLYYQNNEKLKYKFGFFIDFIVGNDPKIEIHKVPC